MASISLALPAQAPALAVLLLLGACGGGTAPPAASPSSSVAAADASSPSARALASALQADAGGEQTVVLQQGLNGYSGTADAYVFSSHNALNFGAAETLNDKSADRTRFRSLVRFAIFQSEGGPVPDGANISAATLSLYKSSSYDTKYQLRPVIADWVEGEVTWDQRRQGVPWTGPGATAAGSDIAVSSDGTADAPKTPSWVAFDVTTGVQAIADGRSNRGWMLDPISGNGNVKTFHSSEYTADGSLRPMLSVRFTVTSSNAPPNISLTAPAASQSFAVGDIITLSAAASDSDGSISRVEFYADGVKLGEDSSAPYSMSWSGAAIGNHVLSAIAHDNLGASKTSASVTVTVTQASSGIEQTVTLRDGLNGYTGTADAYIFSAHNTLNFGAAPVLNDKATDRTRFRTLLRFAIFQSEGGPVPNGATISAATLSLYKSSSYDTRYELRPVLANWVEGEVTWDRSRQGVSWAGPGATAEGSDIAASSEGTADASKAAGWVSFDVISGIRAIVGGRSNHGWLLHPISGNGNVKTFHSSEYMGENSLRPSLTVRFQSGAGGSDTQAPSVPGSLSATSASATTVLVQWAAASDNAGVAAYRIYRDGVQIGTVSARQFSDEGLQASRTYRYTIEAVDAAGNVSAPAIAASVTTQPVAGTVIQANPGNYLELLARLQPGQTLQLAAGRYGVDAAGRDTAQPPGLPIVNLHGTASAPIIITGPASGPAAVMVGRATHNTVRLDNASHIILRNLEIDSRDLGGFGVRAEGVTHDITVENLLIYGVGGGNQQIVGIAVNRAPAWNWVIRRNRIIGAGTGMYLGSSSGNLAFVSALIEHNLVQDSIGYNIQLKHQNSWASVPAGMPTGATTTTVRHNVFSKRNNLVTADGARPNLLIGDVPASGPGSGNGYNVYGNFFYMNPTEPLLQAEGRVAIHNNLLVNTSGSAIRIHRQNGAVRDVAVFANTIVARDLGIELLAGLAGTTQHVVGNAVFAGTPLSLSGANLIQADNITGTLASAAIYLNAPQAEVGQLDLVPKSGQLQGALMSYRVPGAWPDGDRDFNGALRGGLTRGAYNGTAVNTGWRLALDTKP